MIKLRGHSRIIQCDETVQAVRLGETTYKDGLAVHRNPETFDIKCNCQPLSDRDLMLVPEGDRFKENWWLWSMKDSKPIKLNDRIIRNGINYQVQGVGDWGSYNKCRLVRIDVGSHSNP